jgi:hypothetical protein
MSVGTASPTSTIAPNPFGLYEKVRYAIDNISTLFREEDESILDLIFECRGAIYGGYLRDIISKVAPKDIDCVLPEKTKHEFQSGIAALGYVMSHNDTNDTDVYVKTGGLDVEVYYLDEDPDVASLGPVTDPDFSVNLLSYVDGKLDSWIGGNIKDLNLVDVVEDILLKETTQLSSHASTSRIKKIQDKGYKIIGLRDIETELNAELGYDT